jgi:hypothetical protein
MACISGVEVGKYPHSPGCRPDLSRAKRLAAPARMVEFSEESRIININMNQIYVMRGRVEIYR